MARHAARLAHPRRDHRRRDGRDRDQPGAAPLTVAAAVGVTGWVRNLPDSSVEAEVEGTPEQVDRVLAWMAQGPPGAHVDTAMVTDAEPTAVVLRVGEDVARRTALEDDTVVEERERRLQGERPDDIDALLLSARQNERQCVALVGPSVTF